MIAALGLGVARFVRANPQVVGFVLGALVVVAVWFHGDRNGAARERALHEARTAALIAARQADGRRIAALADQLAEAQAARDEAARELEEAANADDEAGRVALPARSVLRLDRR